MTRRVEIYTPTRREDGLPFVDVSKPDYGVEVETSEDRDRIWINVDGICVLRVCNIKPGMLWIDGQPYSVALRTIVKEYGSSEIERPTPGERSSYER